MTSATILIPDRLTEASIEQSVLGPRATIVLPCRDLAGQVDTPLWRSADAIIAWHEVRLTAEVIDLLDRCRVIVRCGVGFDNVDLEAAGKRGIPVCNVPDYGTADIADHSVALMLTLARGLPAMSEGVRISNGYWRWGTAGPLRRMADATWGIVGLGRIGSATALRAKAFGVNVLFFDPYVPDGVDKALGVKRADRLTDLLERSDFVSLHTVLTDETTNLADDSFFGALKPGAVLVNTSRGAVVNTRALERALRSGRVAAAGLDVLEHEPPANDDPLFSAWRNRESWIANRLVITPHCAFYCTEAYQEMRLKAAREVHRVLAGEAPRNCVNRAWLQ